MLIGIAIVRIRRVISWLLLVFRFLSGSDGNDEIESTVYLDLYGVATVDKSVNPSVCIR